RVGDVDVDDRGGDAGGGGGDGGAVGVEEAGVRLSVVGCRLSVVRKVEHRTNQNNRAFPTDNREPTTTPPTGPSSSNPYPCPPGTTRGRRRALLPRPGWSR